MEPQIKPISPQTFKRVGIAADHGGFELKEFLAAKLRAAGFEVTDFGDGRLQLEDDYPDFIIPLARAVAAGAVERGIGICGSGVGAAIAANKVAGVRASLIDENFSAHQGVEDDDLNLICLGGLVIGHALAWELVQTFLTAKFKGAERFRRRLAKVAQLESEVQPITKTAALPETISDGYRAPMPPHEMTISEAVAVWRNEGDPN